MPIFNPQVPKRQKEQNPGYPSMDSKLNAKPMVNYLDHFCYYNQLIMNYIEIENALKTVFM